MPASTSDYRNSIRNNTYTTSYARKRGKDAVMAIVTWAESDHIVRLRNRCSN